MTVVNLNNIKKSYGLTDVLNGFSLTVNDDEKMGLIGPNGSGKTTIFRIISGMEPYKEGTLSIRNKTRVGYLSQLPEFKPDNTLFTELKSVFSEVISLKEEMSELEQTISKLGHKTDDKSKKQLDKCMKEYSKMRQKFEKMGGYGYESRIRKVAVGLGFTLDELKKKVKTFSGGEKTRLGLVKLLLSEPDLLLLDEPTNHLDIPSIQWLEDYLKDYDGSVMIISHDRYFLDKVVTRIVEIKNGEDEVYQGNYSYYLKERKRRYEKRLHKYETQQKKIKELKEAIKRLKKWGNRGDNKKLHRRAKSMQKTLDKMDKIKRPTLGGEKMNLEFDIDQKGGNEVLRVDKLKKSFDGDSILKGLDLDLYRGEKSAVIGENGTGKSTLLKIIIGEEEPDDGKYDIGTNVKVGYYRQEFEGFNPSDNLISALRREVPMKEGKARDLLAGFLFREDEVFKKVRDLSGGEKSRLRLLQLMQGNYNFLILDEPTNHLDLPSREVLEEALKEYPGTILVVSHDRYFLNKIIDYTYELEDGELTKYYGNYDYYRKKKKERDDVQKETSSSENNKKDNFYFRQKRKQRKERKKQKKINNLEEKIMELENRLEKLEDEMTAPENLDNYNLLNELKQEYEEIEDQLEGLYDKWEKQIS